jgi:SAM-dependent methyltransferase
MRLNDQVSQNAPHADARVRQVLNVGSGATSISGLHPAFRGERWREVRFDIDAGVRPDIVGSVLDLANFVAKASYDAIWCSHVLEHLHTHEVVPALRQFRGALNADGFALISCPDLKAVARFILENEVETIAYESGAGPIRALDMIYGHARSIAQGRGYMAHHTGFTRERLGRVALDAGFSEARVLEGPGYDLWALLLMPDADLESLSELFRLTNQRAFFDEKSASEREIDFIEK